MTVDCVARLKALGKLKSRRKRINEKDFIVFRVLDTHKPHSRPYHSEAKIKQASSLNDLLGWRNRKGIKKCG